jgi:long-chain acyl-CoA synthetase
MKRMEVREIYRKILKAGQPTKETPSAEITSSPCREKVFEILKTISKAPTISLDDHLELDLGLDSLGKIETLVALEKAFHLKSDETDFSKIFRVRELVELVEKTVGGAGQVEGGEGRMEWKKILQAEFPEDLKKQIDLKSGRGALFFMSCLDALAWPFVKLFFRLEVAGAENIPEGGVILCPNHVSYMDGPIVHLAVPRRLRSNLFFVGIGKFFNDPAMRPLTRLSRVIPLDASTNIVEALKTSAYVIGRGKILCLFPEGGRSATGELREPKKGAGILAKELNLKVVPVYINGTYEAWKPTAFLPRPFPVKVTFGSAYSWEDLKQLSGEPDTTQDYEAISRGIKEAMKRLKNDE